jgi:hypothetical protein
LDEKKPGQIAPAFFMRDGEASACLCPNKKRDQGPRFLLGKV